MLEPIGEGCYRFHGALRRPDVGNSVVQREALCHIRNDGEYIRGIIPKCPWPLCLVKDLKNFVLYYSHYLPRTAINTVINDLLFVNH